MSECSHYDTCTGIGPEPFEPDYPLPEWRFEMLFAGDDPNNTLPGRYCHRYPSADLIWVVDFEFSVHAPSYCKRVGHLTCYKVAHFHSFKIPYLFSREEGTEFLSKHYPNADIRLFAK